MVRWVAQRPLDSGVAILVVDPPLAAGAGRAGVGRGGEDLPILGHLPGVVSEPPVHHVGDLGDAGPEDERQTGVLDGITVLMAEHSRINHHGDVGELLGGPKA